jgi:hypothetical protein
MVRSTINVLFQLFCGGGPPLSPLSSPLSLFSLHLRQPLLYAPAHDGEGGAAGWPPQPAATTSQSRPLSLPPAAFTPALLLPSPELTSARQQHNGVQSPKPPCMVPPTPKIEHHCAAQSIHGAPRLARHDRAAGMAGSSGSQSHPWPSWSDLEAAGHELHGRTSDGRSSMRGRRRVVLPPHRSPCSAAASRGVVISQAQRR